MDRALNLSLLINVPFFSIQSTLIHSGLDIDRTVDCEKNLNVSSTIYTSTE